MSESSTAGSVKTFAIRVPSALHAQFALVAALEDLSLNDAGVLAIQTLVDAKRADSDFGTRAATVLASIEAEAEARRTAIQALFAEEAATTDAPTKRRTRASE